MYPILFEWGPVVIPSWHAFYVLGAILAYVLLVQMGRRHAPEIDPGDLARLYIICYLAGYFGARTLSILIEEPNVKDPMAFVMALTRFGAMTFYGGAITSFAAGALYAWRRRLRITVLMDLAVPAGLLALVIGRIGCFLNGDDYGNPVSWGIVFPSLKDGIPRHPAQLYEAGSVGMLLVVLLLSFNRLRSAFKPGIVGLFAVIGYANLRFVLEWTRGDFRGFAFGTWMSTSQFISVLVLLACALSTPYWLKR